MSDSGIDLSKLPTLADADSVEDNAKKIRDGGQDIEDKAGDIEGAWQGLQYSYSAPESETLLAALKPTKDDGETVKDNAKTVYDALKTYADTERDLKDQLKTLQGDVASFESSISGDDDWRKDEDKINQRNGLIDRVNGLVSAHETAEQDCATKINGIFGGVEYRTMPADGTPPPPGVEYYAKSKDLLNSATAAGETPWATNVEWDKPWYRDAWDGVTSFGTGLWESLKGTVTGTLALVNPFDWDTFSSTWKGIGTLALDVATVATPVGLLRGADARAESGTRLKAVGEAMINLEEWKNNPAKAAGMLTGDVLLTIGTGGAGAAMKGTSVAGKAGKMASAAGKAGKAGGAKAVDLSKALASNSKIHVKELATDPRRYLRDSKAIYGRTLADARTGAANAGFKALDKAMPKAAAAVNAIDRFQTFTRATTNAAKDAAAAVKFPSFPSGGTSPALVGVPNPSTLTHLSLNRTSSGPVATFRESFERNTTKSTVETNTRLGSHDSRAGHHATASSSSSPHPDPQNGKNLESSSAPIDHTNAASGGKGPNGPGDSWGNPSDTGRPRDGVTVRLHPKDDWEPRQTRQYDAKVEHLDGEAKNGRLVYTDSRRGPSIRNTLIKDPERAIKLGLPDEIDANEFRRATEHQRKAMLAKYDLDHKTDLQLGGKDDIYNMQWLDSSVNRSIGSQINRQYTTNRWHNLVNQNTNLGPKVARVEG